MPIDHRACVNADRGRSTAHHALQSLTTGSHDMAQLLLYLDQNYLSGMAKRKPAFAALEPVLRAAV
jgi:hypothetical protein